ncbi:MAG TPA: hypothetical protein VMU51_12575 [Mycobacteriales bacterium]|nr:hypothetical protein [Mycobacteriales bacterium]
MAVIHRALDSRQFQLAGQLDLGQPATSVLGVSAAGRLHEFTAGLAALGAEVAAGLGGSGPGAGFDEELSYQGGALRIGRLHPYDPQIKLTEDLLVACWQGERHCLVTQLYAAGTTDLLGLLRTLRIEEHPDGLAVRPALAGGSEFTGPATVIKQVPALGLLEMSPLTSEHVKTLPSWGGLRTPAGELFADNLTDGKPYYVLAAPDTWTTLVPAAGLAGDRLAGQVGRLRIQLVG